MGPGEGGKQSADCRLLTAESGGGGEGPPPNSFPETAFACLFTVCLVRERSEPGRSEPVPVAVWLEDGRVGLAPEWNIPLRCGLDSSIKI